MNLRHLDVLIGSVTSNLPSCADGAPLVTEWVAVSLFVHLTIPPVPVGALIGENANAWMITVLVGVTVEQSTSCTVDAVCVALDEELDPPPPHPATKVRTARTNTANRISLVFMLFLLLYALGEQPSMGIPIVSALLPRS